MEPDNLGDILQARAQAHPERTLFCFYAGDGGLVERFSYGSFQRRVNYVARRLCEAGIAAGQPVLLVYPPGTEMAVAFFACAHIGAVPVPAPPPQKQQAGWSRLVHIARHAGAGHILATSDLAAQVASYGLETADAFSGLAWIATDAMAGELDSYDQRPSETLFVQYTSGSTSAPRGVAVTHRNVIHNAGLCVDHEQPVGVSWLPHFHDMGLLGYFLFSVVKGGEAHCFSPLGFLRRPVLWLELISRVGATITTAPNAAYEYCLREEKVPDALLAGIDLGSLRSMVNCAEPVRPRTFERFAERFSRYGLRQAAYVAGYGLAEHTLCVTTGGRRVIGDEAAGGEDAAPGSGRFVSCGKPAEGVDLRLVDPGTRLPVAAGEVGEIWVDSPSKAAGYWRLPELSEAQFRAKIAGEESGRGYLRTGDLGFLSDGELYVCGRLRDMLVLNGKNVFPADVEALLEERFTRLLSGRVAGFGVPSADAGTEELVILVETAAEVVDLRHLRSLVQDGLGIAIGVVARVPRGTIVRTSSGKVARRRCRERWEGGQIEALEIIRASSAEASVEELIEGFVSQAQALGEPNATLDQLGLDSIALVNFSLALERLLKGSGFDSPDIIEGVADLSLLQALRVADLRSALRIFRSGREGVVAVLELLDGAAGKLRREENRQMHADAALPLPARKDNGRERGTGALVTGATGFVGAYIVKSLLEQTDEPVTVLVRCRDPAHGVARIRHALLDTDMSTAAVGVALHSRIRVVAGDLARPRLGLSGPEWDKLAEGVGRIYHSGAEVDYVKSYKLLREANVLATREVIALAAEGRRKSLHHISTTFVFGWSTQQLLLESDENFDMNELDFGYAQSKWVAEQLVRRAQREGLSATIFRPALVTASASGRFVRRDITARVLGYMIRNGLTVDAPNQVSFLPVDVCARNIVALSRQPDALAPVLHMTSDDYRTIGDVCKVITQRYGYPFVQMSLEDFVAHAHAHCRPDDELYPLLSFLDRNTKRILRMGDKRYDSSAYRSARDRDTLATQHPSLEQIVDPIVAFLQREGLIPPSVRQPELRDGEAAAGARA